MRTALVATVLAGFLGVGVTTSALAQQTTWKIAVFGPPRAVTARESVTTS